LQDVIQMALNASPVIRDLGGRVIAAPSSVRTALDADLRALHPRLGIATALSEFDTQFTTSLFWNRDDSVSNRLNNYPNGVIDEDVIGPVIGLRKRTISGGQVYGRLLTNHEDTNSLNARFTNFWNSDVELGFRQPLLRGRGPEYNLIAGASANQDLLLSNGVWIAQIDTDISAVEFQTAIAEFVSNVETAYWELGFAYQALQARRQARNSAKEQLEQVLERQRAGLRGGEAQNEAVAREQLYIFEAQYLDALTGTESQPGMRLAERRLRELLGLPADDGAAFLRPVDEPPTAKFVFDADAVINEAVAARPELHQQRLRVKRRELQLIAAKNFLLPQLDFVANYQFQGYGDDLFGDGNQPFSSAFRTLSEFDHGTYELGLEFVVPLGFRQARSGVQHAELQLSRENAILLEQERRVAHEVTAALQELARANSVAHAQRKRLEATEAALTAIDEALRAERTTLDVRLAAERRRLDARLAYTRVLADHAIALKNIEWKRGALPHNAGVYISGSQDAPPEPVLNPPQGAHRMPINADWNETVLPHNGQLPSSQVATPVLQPEMPRLPNLQSERNPWKQVTLPQATGLQPSRLPEASLTPHIQQTPMMRLPHSDPHPVFRPHKRLPTLPKRVMHF
jgi:outer membrane protein TolC